MAAVPIRRAFRHACRALRAGGRLLAAAVRRYATDGCGHSAAAISYQVLFSLLPLSVLGAGVLGVAVRDPAARARVVDLVVGLVPLTPAGRDQIAAALGELAGLSTLGLLGAAGLLWSASGVIGAVRTALHRVWRLSERRPWVRGKLADISLAAAASAAAALAVGLTLAARGLHEVAGRVAGSGPLAPAAGAGACVLSVAVPLAAETALFVLLYRTCLPRSAAALIRPRGLWRGAAVAAVGFELAKNGFALYVTHLRDYNRIYGSLGAVVIFMVFVYLTASVFLFGAAVAAEDQRRGGSTPAGAGPHPRG